jgi:hypothetical protein
MMNVQDVIAAIHRMDNDELNRVVETIKMRRNYNARQKARTFVVGDRVSFAARGMQVLGTVTKVNIKTIQVRQSNSATVWKVHASLLRPVKEFA